MAALVIEKAQGVEPVSIAWFRPALEQSDGETPVQVT